VLYERGNLLEVSINLDGYMILYLTNLRLVSSHSYDPIDMMLLCGHNSKFQQYWTFRTRKLRDWWAVKRANRCSQGAKNRIVTVKGR